MCKTKCIRQFLDCVKCILNIFNITATSKEKEAKVWEGCKSVFM